MSLIRATNLTKTYRAGDVDVPAVRGVDFAIEPASFVAFVGEINAAHGGDVNDTGTVGLGQV